MTPKRILIDTDPGIDDSLAILLALASPEVQIEGLSTVAGNCSAEQGTINALSVLEMAKAAHIPVAKGCELPLVQPSLLAPETHGDTGIDVIIANYKLSFAPVSNSTRVDVNKLGIAPNATSLQ